MNFLKINFTVAIFSLLTFAFSSQLNAQVDPSAYANGIKAIVEINSKGEILALKMAPLHFKPKLHRVEVKLSVQNNRLQMESIGMDKDTLLHLIIRESISLSPSLAKALGISNSAEARLKRGTIILSNRKKTQDIPTVTPLKMARRK